MEEWGRGGGKTIRTSHYPAVTHDAKGAQHVRYNLHHVWPSATYHTMSQGIEIFCTVQRCARSRHITGSPK